LIWGKQPKEDLKLMDKKLRLGSNPLEWIIIFGLRYYSIILIVCLSLLFYLYANLPIVKLIIIGVTISFAWLIKKGVVLDLEDLSKRIRSLEEKCKDLKDGDSVEEVIQDNKESR
jgi:hypothetical protein